MCPCEHSGSWAASCLLVKFFFMGQHLAGNFHHPGWFALRLAGMLLIGLVLGAVVAAASHFSFANAMCLGESHWTLYPGKL